MHGPKRCSGLSQPPPQALPGPTLCHSSKARHVAVSVTAPRSCRSWGKGQDRGVGVGRKSLHAVIVRPWPAGALNHIWATPGSDKGESIRVYMDAVQGAPMQIPVLVPNP